MNTKTITALLALSQSNWAEKCTDLIKESIPELVSLELVEHTANSVSGAAGGIPEPTYSLTKKGNDLVTLINKASEYFQDHQEVKKGITEILGKAKDKYNTVLDSLKFD